MFYTYFERFQWTDLGEMNGSYKTDLSWVQENFSNQSWLEVEKGQIRDGESSSMEILIFIFILFIL